MYRLSLIHIYSRELAVEDLKAHGLTANDLVVGIAASGRTPYVLGGLDLSLIHI